LGACTVQAQHSKVAAIANQTHSLAFDQIHRQIFQLVANGKQPAGLGLAANEEPAELRRQN
jgi:hypothetical protein